MWNDFMLTVIVMINVISVIMLDDFILVITIITRFGKLGVVWSGSKCVDIEINGREVDILLIFIIIIFIAIVIIAIVIVIIVNIIIIEVITG